MKVSTQDVTCLAVGALACAAPVFAAADAASSCALPTASAKVPTPSVAPGYEVRLIASGLTKPRGMTFDSQGHLLVVQQQHNLAAITLKDNGGSCVSMDSMETVVDDDTLNHGITLSHDQKTLYASSPEAVFSWAYDPMTAKTMSKAQTLVANMTTDDHTTRTLLLPRMKNGTLIVTRGSTANIDPLTENIMSGHSQIKAFDLDSRDGKTYDFDTTGDLLGWGMRNDVGIDEHPITGGLYSVENSVDQLQRSGVDVHANNPGEKLNFLGYLNGTKSKNQGSNFGYPFCYAAWDVSALPNNEGMKTGMQFAMGTPNASVNDKWCQTMRTPPRMVFEAHMAPLDIKFNKAGSEAWVSFHGSWDRDDPAGYKVSVIPFANGEPVAPSTSNTGYLDMVANKDNSQCPDNCFRPAGLAWDNQGRLFFSSDSTGEIYMITQKSGASMQSATPALPSGTSSATPSASSSMASGNSNAGSKKEQSLIFVTLVAALAAMLLM